MSKAQEIAELYFQLSNKSDFENLAQLFTASTTYSSENTGLYVGSNDILDMQKSFHNNFSSLNWEVKSVNEVKQDIILFEYNFKARKLNGEKVNSSGIEYIVIHNGKIQHIEIRNK